MKRKTDDKVILTMLKKGKTQKAIADYFGVSPVAIHKRVKRLLPPPESLEGLTDKEQRFALSVAKGKTQTEAALESFDVTSRESAKVMGSQLMAKAEVRQAVGELMALHGLSRSYRIKRLKDHIENRDPHVSLKGLDMSFKLDSSYPPAKSINLNANMDFAPVDLSKYRNINLEKK